MAGRDAVLFRAHRHGAGAAAELQRIVRAVEPGLDVWVVGYCPPGALDGFGHPRTKAYGAATLSRLPYPAKIADMRWERPTGGNDLPVLQFFREHPGYDRYWPVESDVRFTSDWGALFADLSRSRAGLLGTTVQSFDDNPGWANWPTLRTGAETVERSQWIKAFIPFAGVTGTALAAIDAGYRAGWTGHSEAVWATIVGRSGLGVEDIGGSGRFTPAGRRGRYYWNSPLDPHLRPGCFVFRPTVAPGQDDQAWTGEMPDAVAWANAQLRVAGRLVHPVKG